MRKRIICAVGLLCLMVGLSSMATASELDLFLERCASCHKDGAEAPPVNPAAKAGVVWAKYFKRDRHPGDLNVSANEMADILRFLQNHAADSDHPVAAVIPK